jgi:hypothetical protein
MAGGKHNAVWTGSRPMVLSCNFADRFKYCAGYAAVAWTLAAVQTSAWAGIDLHPRRPVVAAAQTTVRRVSFLNDVEPILTRAGRNQGACHGSQFGKGGFKLSLAAYDPRMDHDSIVRQDRGRRVSAVSPEASLLLRKAAMELPHAGGLILDCTSDDYRTIANWIREGAPGPDPGDPHVTALDVAPDRKMLRSRESVQVTVHARYSDSTRRDVTAHARINSLNHRIASATTEGRVSAHGCGETAIMLRYDGQVAVLRIVIPYTPSVASRAAAATKSSASYVDLAIANQWREFLRIGGLRTRRAT